MVCTANDLLGWKDFPKGLRVLLLDEDSSSAAEIRSKLEQMDYIVSTFCNEDEALSAISNKPEGFHIAIVEVNTSNCHGSFTFLEVAKNFPTIMTAKKQCLTTMMKCIALGAVEFLLKPLSDDKLRNIWQHVVHKAFHAEGNEFSESLKLKESVVSMLHFQLENGEQKRSISVETENEILLEENSQEQSPGSDEYPAPPTPQLEQGVRLVDDGDCQDQMNCSMEKQSGNKCGEPKSVDTTCANIVAETNVDSNPPPILGGGVVKEEDESPGVCKNGSDNMLLCPQNKDGPNESAGEAQSRVKASGVHSSCGHKANRKKMKVDWRPELHKKFVRAVEQLGVDQAIPSRILELMKVEELTRHNVASHLQKYRMQRRHILPKEEVKRPPHPRDPLQRSYYPHKHVMPFPPYHSNHIVPACQFYQPWGPPHRGYPTGVHTWGHAFYPPWQPAESWHWKPYPGVHADAWGCPVMPTPCPAFPQNASGYHSANTTHGSYGLPYISFDLQLEEEAIDKAVNEAISKPWLPLPLGLKPPSTDGVLTELSKQGISCPSPLTCHHATGPRLGSHHHHPTNKRKRG